MMARRGQVPMNRDLLKVLHRAKPNLRRAILKEADRSLVYQICELCDNTLRGNVNLTKKQKQELAKHKHVLRKLSQPRGAWQTKKRALLQKGGAFLPILLSVLGSVLPAILGK
jgi:hypothetical protein